MAAVIVSSVVEVLVVLSTLVLGKHSSQSKVDGDRFLGGRVEDKRGAENVARYSRHCREYMVAILGVGG